MASRLDTLRTVGFDPDPALLEAISTYIELLLRWNRKINLTAITEPVEIVDRNFAESFFAARWLGAVGGRLCDVGSGAGFPGLALKLVSPLWSVTLLEPSAKKAAFLSDLARTLGLMRIEVRRTRWQESNFSPVSLDAITVRALGAYEPLAHWARTSLKADGKLLLWVGAGDAKKLSTLPGWRWRTEPVPGSRERVLLIGFPS